MSFARVPKIMAFTLLYLVVGGYRFGTGDHVSQLPTVLHFFDPNLYQTDFPMQMIFPWYVKSGLFIALSWISHLLNMPMEYLFFLTYLIVLFLYLAWMDELMAIVGINKEFRELGLLLLLPYSYLYQSVSHFHLVTLRLVPYFFVLPFCIKTTTLFIEKRYFLASLFCALIFLIHQQIGLIIFGTVIFSQLVQALEGQVEKKAILFLALPFLMLFVVHFFVMQLFGQYRGYPWFDLKWGKELLEMVRFRVPHHLLLSYSGFVEWAFFGLAAFFATFVLLKVEGDRRVLKPLTYMAVAILMASLAGFIFTEIVPLPLAFALYLFRSDVLLRIIGFVSFMLFLNVFLPHKRIGNVVLLLFLITAASGAVATCLNKNIRVFTPRTELTQMSSCIKAKTPLSAFILASPSLKGLRLYSERSVFVSWKSHGLFFPPEIARKWFRRMKLLCNMEEKIPCKGTECKRLCGQNYNALSTKRLLLIAKEYGTDYLLCSKDRELDFDRICETRNLVFYKLK